MFSIPLLSAIVSGALLTYAYDEESSLPMRICIGACTGLSALGLTCFVLASFFGLGSSSIALATVIVLAASLWFFWRTGRERLRADWRSLRRSLRHALFRPTPRTISLAALTFGAALAFWAVFDRAMIVRADGIYTGVENNLGDLPLHLSIIQSFATGGNFPPEHPELAGARLTYPFLADFIAAIFVRAGASIRDAMFYENLTLSIALIFLLYEWARRWTNDWLAATMTPALVLLNGGLGWWLLFDEARRSPDGLSGLLWKLPHDYTITPDGMIRWGNAITALLVTQRSFLLGLPLVVIVLSLWWQAVEIRQIDGTRGAEHTRRPAEAKVNGRRRMIAAGIITGLLPFAHAHSFLVVIGASFVLAILSRCWRLWLYFFGAAILIASPQVLWMMRGSAIESERFIGWSLGWDNRGQNFFWFWLKNTGAFIPLLVAALLWRGQRALVDKKLLFFYAPFILCFLIPNLIKLAPWVWDNIKVLFYWYVASTPLVALLLARWWRGGWIWRPLVLLLFLSLILAGGLDVWRVISRASEYQLFDRQKIAFARLIEERTPPRSIILHAPTYNHAMRLTGRLSYMGFVGHLWTHGLRYEEREDRLQRVYASRREGREILRHEDIDYIVVGPDEREMMSGGDWFATSYQLVARSGDYKLYKVAR